MVVAASAVLVESLDTLWRLINPGSSSGIPKLVSNVPSPLVDALALACGRLPIRISPFSAVEFSLCEFFAIPLPPLSFDLTKEQ